MTTRGSGSPAPADWDAVLCRYSAVLDAHELALDRVEAGEVVEVAPFTAPAGLPPLPVELAGRARELADRTARVLARARAATDRADAPRPLTVHRPARGAVSSRLDVTG